MQIVQISLGLERLSAPLRVRGVSNFFAVRRELRLEHFVLRVVLLEQREKGATKKSENHSQASHGGCGYYHRQPSGVHCIDTQQRAADSAPNSRRDELAKGNSRSTKKNSTLGR